MNKNKRYKPSQRESYDPIKVQWTDWLIIVFYSVWFWCALYSAHLYVRRDPIDSVCIWSFIVLIALTIILIITATRAN